MITATQALTLEASEIIRNINMAARDMEITALQRSELIAMVQSDVKAKQALAANMLYVWTGNYKPTSPAVGE